MNVGFANSTKHVEYEVAVNFHAKEILDPCYLFKLLERKVQVISSM
jgi:hypothetical protein